MGRVDSGGAAAEYMKVPAGLLVKAPDSIPLADAAAIPIAGLTAWQAVYDYAGVSRADRVLINGAGGGVGAFAVQLAKRVGATVIAVAGPHSAEAAAAYGADEIIDRTRLRPADAVARPVDAVINLAPITPEAGTDLARLADPHGGRVVSITLPIGAPPGLRISTAQVSARNSPAQLAQIADLVDAGALTVHITGTRPLADLPLIHEEAESGRLHGKIIVSMTAS
jgi:NADPH:quinone reductase-like Zn-dependent oxidoreductase